MTILTIIPEKPDIEAIKKQVEMYGVIVNNGFKFEIEDMFREYDLIPYDKCIPIKDIIPVEPTEQFYVDLTNTTEEEMWEEFDLLSVVKIGGRYYILDGHHRYWITVEFGYKNFDCFVYDIDHFVKTYGLDKLNRYMR